MIKSSKKLAIVKPLLRHYTSFKEANLEGIRNLTIEQLSKVETLYGARGLDPELERQIKEKYPHLLEEPKEEVREKG